MTQEEKSLLLQDLCARLPYGVKVKFAGYSGREDCTLNAQHLISTYNIEYLRMKPYLRPLSSMTEEEKKDLLVTIVGNEGSKYFQVLQDGSIDNTDETIQDLNKFNMHWINFDKDTVTLYIDWLNAHHFDYRGLIQLGLAIEVTKENNPYKE